MGVLYVPEIKYKQKYPTVIVCHGLCGTKDHKNKVDMADALFKAAVVSTTTNISYMGRTDANRNATLVQNNGSTVTGNSAVAIQSTTGTATTLPVRIVDFVPETTIAGEPGSYTEVIVKWVAGVHRYTNPTGV